MLKNIETTIAEKIIGREFRDIPTSQLDLHWTDHPDTLSVINLLAECKNILEIGTHKGHTAKNLERHTGADITTVDVERHPVVFNLNSGRITRIIASSSNHLSSHHDYDGYFIDGDHTYSGVKRDTEDILQHIGSGGIIVWHDVYSDMPVFQKKPDEGKDPSAVNIQVAEYLQDANFTAYKIGKAWVAFMVME